MAAVKKATKKTAVEKTAAKAAPKKTVTKKKVVKKTTTNKKPQKNTGIPFEQLTREVFARMEGIKQMGGSVTHNVVLTGKSGTSHQVDVYAEFALGETRYKTIISCKDYSSPVKKSHVMELHDLLGEIPGQPRGVLVSRSGFQQGAINYAKHHGIGLYQLREKQEEDWDGLIKEIHMTMTFQVPRYDLKNPDLDMDWARERLKNMGITGGQWELVGGGDGDRKCILESGKATTWNALFDPHMPTEPNTIKEVLLTFEGDRPMLPLQNFPLSHVPMKSTTVRISYSVIQQPMIVNFDHVVAYCFRDALSGKFRFLGADGGPPS